jgi:peptide/nickel transport system substrate-binding protein
MLAAMMAAPVGAIAATPADQIVIGDNLNTIVSLDPAAKTGPESSEILTNVYDFLVEVDPVNPLNIKPSLAKSWEVSPDGNKLTFHLRDDVKFHSGNPLTAADFLWGFERALALDLNQATAWKSFGFTKDNYTKQITAPDPYTIVIDLPKPTDPKLVIYLLSSNMVSAFLDSKLAKEHIANNDYAAAWLDSNDAGSGPFKLTRWDANDVVILDRFDGYWQTPALMKRVIFRNMPESQAQRFALEKGDIDVATALSVPDITALQSNKDVAVQSSPGSNYYYLAVNMKDERFQKRDVRMALRYLIDYDNINKTIMPFYGVYHQRPIRIGEVGSLPDPGYKLNVTYAKKLLAEAGYPDGFECTMLVLSNTPWLETGTAIQATLALGGIKANIVQGGSDQVYGPMSNRQFDIVVGRGGGGGGDGAPDPYGSLRSSVYNPDNSDEAKLTSYAGWRTSFFDDTINKLIDAAVLERDPAKQREMYEAVQLRYEDLVPSIQPISQAVYTVVLRADVKNYHYPSTWQVRYREVSKSR